MNRICKLKKGRTPMIFVARYADGTCGIAEAANEADGRMLLESEEAWFKPDDDEIISLRPLTCQFVSRWYFEDVKSNELCEVARLSGMVSHDVAEELYEHEYPMISTAHRTAENEQPLFDPTADQTTPIIKNPAQLKQMKKWGDNLVNRVRQAVEIELNRFNSKG
jgi:hypothetical protein